MDIIAIRSDLSGFVMLDGILDAGPDFIEGFKRLDRAPLYLAIEALAQLGAFHVRYLVDFQKHAFLLGIKSCSLPPQVELSGNCKLFGKLESRGSSAFSYRLTANLEDGAAINGEFMFALAEYGESGFNRDILQSHYRKVFSCLKRDSKTSC